MKKLLTTALAVAAMTAMVSCGSDDPVIDLPIDGKTVTIAIASNEVITASQCLPDNQQTEDQVLWSSFEGPELVLRYDFDKNCLTLTVTNMKFDAELGPISFEADKVGIEKITDDKVRLAVADVVAVADAAGNAHSISELRVWMLRDENRRWDNTIVAAFYMTFKLDGKYLVNIFPYDNHFFGTTVTTTMASGAEFSSTTPVYRLSINPNRRTATLSVKNARFAEAMPPVDMDFNGIPFRFTESGVEFAQSSLIPEAGGAPFDRFRITELSGSFTLEQGVDLQFVCASTWHVDFRGTLAVTAEQ